MLQRCKDFLSSTTRPTFSVLLMFKNRSSAWVVRYYMNKKRPWLRNAERSKNAVWQLLETRQSIKGKRRLRATSKRNTQRLGDLQMVPFREKRISCLVSLAHYGSGVFAAKRSYLASTSCVEVFTSMFRLLAFITLVAEVRVRQSAIWSQSGVIGKCIQRLTAAHITLYQTLFLNPWYW